MEKKFILLCIAVFLHVQFCLSTKLDQAQIQKLKTSVVRVQVNSTNKIGSGFIYLNQKYAITAYHVISGSNGNVKIYYQALGLERTGRVIKTLKSADLALIEISSPVNVPVLATSTSTVDYNTEYTAIGFLWDAKDYFPIDLMKKETRNLNFLPSATLQDITQSGCPSLTLNVFSFAGNPMVPGYSGAPIFDGDESIIGIGDGGIKEGLASVSWGIPCANLKPLFESTACDIGSTVLSHTLYAADNIQFANWATNTLKLNNEIFFKTRTEKLQSIAATTDDIIGLNQILNVFPPQIDKYNIVFDVYQNFTNGAVFILPAGYRYTTNGNKIMMQSNNGMLNFSIDVEHCDLMQMYTLTAQLEAMELGILPGWTWVSDPNFTYPTPAIRYDGFMVRRAANVQQNSYMQYNNYIFESFVYKNNLLMYVSVKNFNFNTPYNSSNYLCAQAGYQGPGCDVKLNELTEWLKMYVAVHFATFSK
jgi:hypothetical protein